MQLAEFGRLSLHMAPRKIEEEGLEEYASRPVGDRLVATPIKVRKCNVGALIKCAYLGLSVN